MTAAIIKTHGVRKNATFPSLSYEGGGLVEELTVRCKLDTIRKRAELNLLHEVAKSSLKDRKFR